jgi:hypothetical protein
MIEQAYSFAEILSCTVIMLLGGILCVLAGRKFGVSTSMGVILYIWHTFFCFAFVALVLAQDGDAFFYYNESLLGEIAPAIGTWGIVGLTRLFSHYLGLSFLACNLIFNIPGCFGLIVLYAVMQRLTKEKAAYFRRLAVFVVFLPSVSFWTAAIGKDSIAFLAIALFLWACRDIRHQLFTVAAAIALMFFVRAHIGMIMLVCTLIALGFGGKKFSGTSLLMMAAGAAGFMLLLPIALDYGSLRNLSSADIANYFDDRQNSTQIGGSALSISDMNLVTRLFTYAFRPMLWETQSAMQFVAAVENLLVISVFILVALQLRSPISPSNYSRLALLTYSAATWFLLSSITGNLGTASRQKWMFLPVLIFLVLSYGRDLVRRPAFRPPPYGYGQVQMTSRRLNTTLR